MRQIELYINGQAVDLPASTKGLVKFSQARAALSDVAARVGEFSFPFTLPASRRNAQVFGVDKLHPLALGKFGYSTDYTYELRAGGRVFSGTFRLTSLQNGYKGTLVGEGLSWALLLGDSKLTDLDFALIDYDGTQLEYILAKDCDSTDVQFPLIAFGNFFSPPTTRTLPDGTTQEVPTPPAAVLDYPLAVDDYPPGVYYGNVLRQIFRGIGWQLQSRELDSPFWRSVVHTCAGADVAAAWPWGSLLKAEQAGTAAGSLTYDLFVEESERSAGAGVWPHQNGDVVFLPLACPLVSSPTRALAHATASYTAPVNGTYSFTWAATLASGRQTWQGIPVISNQLADVFRPVGLGLVVRRGGQDYTDADGGLCNSPLGTAPAYATGQTRVLTPARLDVPGGNRTDLALGSYGGTVSVYLEAGDNVQLAAFTRGLLMSDTGAKLFTRKQFELNWNSVSFACTGYADDNGVSKTQLQPADFLPPLGQKDVVRDFLQRTDSFLVADTSRRVATILSRAELSTAAGAPIDLSDRCDVRSVEYLPALGAGVGSFVFAPAENGDEPLPIPSDVVRAVVGTGEGSQNIGSLYAPVGFRTVYSPYGAASLPTCSTKDILVQNRSEAQPDPAGAKPRLIRFIGPDASWPVPFMQRLIGLGRAAWDGALCWDGVGGAVASYYPATIRRALAGHLARVQVPLSPALYQSLTPGRKVLLNGGSYTVSALQNFDAADEAALCSLDLDREVL